MAWETVIGLEVHVQLRTRTKMFCADRTTFGDLAERAKARRSPERTIYHI